MNCSATVYEQNQIHPIEWYRGLGLGWDLDFLRASPIKLPVDHASDSSQLGYG
jgi:hypothetical protein